MFEELASKVTSGNLIPVLAITLGILAGVVIFVGVSIVNAVQAIRQRQIVFQEMHRLADRGFTAKEIERLVLASSVESAEEMPADGGEADRRA